MPAPNVTVTGTASTSRRLRRLADDLDDIDLTAGSRHLQQASRREAPKLTGALSEDTYVVESQHSVLVKAGRLEYIAPVYAGSIKRNIKPNRYLNRAARRDRRIIVALVTSEVRVGIRRYRRR